MDMVSFTPSGGGSKFSSQKISFDSTHLKNVSFSSYPSSADETAFACKLADTNTSSITVTAAQDDEEIRVFGAERYFNGPEHAESPKNPTTRQNQINQSKKEAKTDTTITPEQPISANHHHRGAMSARSESSWNSQRALLHTRSAKRANKKARSRSFLRSLSCNCACADKNSIDVAEEQEHVGEISFRKTKDQEQEQDQEPAPGEGYIEKMDRLVIGEPNLLSPKAQFHFGDVQKARKSLEVFGSPLTDKRNSKSFKLSWESNPRKMLDNQEKEFPGNGIYSYESGSDASSDLFEIESLTGKGNNNPFLASSGCATPANGYAPSEASIEWSVVTASAADHEEHQRIAAISARDNKTGKVMAQRRRPNILLSCKSQKSVRVAGDAYVAVNDRVNADHMTPSRGEQATRNDPPNPLTRPNPSVQTRSMTQPGMTRAGNGAEI